MGESSEIQPDIRASILEALSSKGCPVTLSDEEKEEIANHCENFAFAKNRNDFEKEIRKIVTEAVNALIIEGTD
ncbi:MAG TPA: hypothetical protein EYQ68_07455 [Cytophagales bacterium]|nr:hypothetical protein [Cytophagales bacterium]